MNLELIQDIEMVILAIQQGDLDDAVALLREIQESHGLDEHVKIFPN